jgi:hypothetical protein
VKIGGGAAAGCSDAAACGQAAGRVSASSSAVATAASRTTAAIATKANPTQSSVVPQVCNGLSRNVQIAVKTSSARPTTPNAEPAGISNRLRTWTTYRHESPGERSARCDATLGTVRPWTATPSGP